jgi:hypothetical protein
MRTPLIALVLLTASTAHAQTPGTPPADPTGSNTASANLPPASSPGAGVARPLTARPSDAASDVPSDDVRSTDTSTRGTVGADPSQTRTTNYPLCSRTVRDACRNRGGR